MGTKNNPGHYDCHSKAEPDEPMFILLARDKTAPRLVLDWAAERQRQIDEGLKPKEDLEQVREAMECALNMAVWRKKHRP